MAEYKKGDIIVIKSDLNNYRHYGSYYVTNEMMQMKNDCAIRKISNVLPRPEYGFSVYKLEEQDNYDCKYCSWTADMFEGLYEPIKVSTGDLMAFLGE